MFLFIPYGTYVIICYAFISPIVARQRHQCPELRAVRLVNRSAPTSREGNDTIFARDLRLRSKLRARNKKYEAKAVAN
jgi:hypothetical protein